MAMDYNPISARLHPVTDIPAIFNPAQAIYLLRPQSKQKKSE